MAKTPDAVQYLIDSGLMAKLPESVIPIVVCIEVHHHQHGGGAIPSVDVLATQTGQTERQVKEALSMLADHGYLKQTFTRLAWGAV